MKNYFVMNPGAGEKKAHQAFLSELEVIKETGAYDIEIYYTKGPKDATVYCKSLCEEAKEAGESIRIYACGGDGTLNEVVNGVVGFDNVEIGNVPLGTGNDYIRNFEGAGNYLDPIAQLRGESKWSDAIKFIGKCGDDVTEGYCDNMFNIGFDCNVVVKTEKVKNLPMISGSMAYLASIFITFVRKEGTNLRIEYPDGSVKDGKILLCSIANGCYCGGGVKGLPKSILDDGLMDVSVVNNVTRRAFVNLFPKYAKGTHLETKEVKEMGMVDYRQEKSLKITSNIGSIKVCIDGEIDVFDSLELSMRREAFKFIVPNK